MKRNNWNDWMGYIKLDKKISIWIRYTKIDNKLREKKELVSVNSFYLIN